MNYDMGTTKNNKVKKELIVRDEVLSKVKAELRRTQQRMKWHYNEGKINVTFEIGDYIYLKLQPYV